MPVARVFSMRALRVIMNFYAPAAEAKWVAL
jgi:hypothetical protein